MRVTSQSTPNPNARKFVLPETVFDRPQSFASADVAAAHSLAAQLFALGSIYNVFMVQDFITVNKLPDVPWDGLEAQVERIIETHFAEQAPTDHRAINTTSADTTSADTTSADTR